MTSCRGMGDAINTSMTSDQGISVVKVLEFCMTYGICPKDLGAIENMCKNKTPPANYAEICKAYNKLPTGATTLIDKLVKLMNDQKLEIRLAPVNARSTIGFHPIKKVPVRKVVRKPKK